MLRLESGKDKLCVEHIFYGLLLAACYKEEPFNKTEYRAEAEKLRSYMNSKVASIASARFQLNEDALNDNSRFRDGSDILAKASVAAGSNDLDAVTLAKTVLEAPTPVIERLMKIRHTGFVKEDGKYPAEKPVEKPVINKAAESDSNDKSDDEAVQGTSTAKALLALALLAAALDNQNETLHQNSGKVKANNKRKRRTKMGLFTYRGGTVAAAIQYFLFGIFVPFAALAVLELLTGFATNTTSSFCNFAFGIYMSLWVFYLLRGVTLLLGLKSNAFGLFMNLMTDFLLIYLLGSSVQEAWFAAAGYPLWLKIVMTLAAIIVIAVGYALYDMLKSEGNALKTKIFLNNEEGTPAKIFFKTLTKELVWPVIYFALIWMVRGDFSNVSAKEIHWAELIGFLWVWIQFQTLYTCIHLHNSKSIWKSGKGAKFFISAHILMLPAELVLCLHLIFGWSPIRVWVIVLLSIYSALMLLAALVYAANGEDS